MNTSGRRSAKMARAVAQVLAGSTQVDAAARHGVTTRGLRRALKADGRSPMGKGRPRKVDALMRMVVGL